MCSIRFVRSINEIDCSQKDGFRGRGGLEPAVCGKAVSIDLPIWRSLCKIASRRWEKYKKFLAFENRDMLGKKKAGFRTHPGRRTL